MSSSSPIFTKEYELADKITEGYRPRLSESWPESWQQLIEMCWASTPSQRPNFGDIEERLNEIRENLV